MSDEVPYEFQRLDSHIESLRREANRIEQQRQAAQDESVRRLMAALEETE